MWPKMIYLDNNSTTRVDPRVVEAILPFFDTVYGNAASTSHAMGWAAADAVSAAIDTIAACIGAESREIVMTSGATESMNLAIKGAAPFLENRGKHLISSVAEHKAGIDAIKLLAKQGWKVSWLRPDSSGRVHADQVAEAMTAETSLCSIMLANNELGTINPIAEIAEVCRLRSVILHSDATAAVGKMAVDVDGLGVDLMSFSAHKFYGPKGVGGLYVRRRGRAVRLVPQIEGGGHQRGYRSGTLAVGLIAGMARALEISTECMLDEMERLRELRDLLESRIRDGVDGVNLNGDRASRIGNTLNLRFGGVSGEALMLSLKGLAISSGSACSASDPEPSHVLRSIGLSDDEARSSLRFSLGRFNTREEIEQAAADVVMAVKALRELVSSI